MKKANQSDAFFGGLARCMLVVASIVLSLGSAALLLRAHDLINHHDRPMTVLWFGFGLFFGFSAYTLFRKAL